MLTEKSSSKIFGGFQKVFSHESEECKCTMTFAIFLPEKSNRQKCPVVYWLSGLTCNEQNVITKSGFQRAAAKFGLVIVCPDTSPRGEGIPNDDAYDFGVGAGFYIDATAEPWQQNFRMYSYITKELPELIETNFPIDKCKQGIFGHSMGGHGALISALKNPDKYKSVSAFAPICHPTHCPWGLKAFSGYLGLDKKEERWNEYDAVELIKSGRKFPSMLLVDQGDSDNFLSQGQLLPKDLEDVCKQNGLSLNLRMQEGYDHSYYFISTFIDDHLEFHSKILNGGAVGEMDNINK